MKRRSSPQNPKFAQSIALGGADADVISDGLLLDWKTTKKAGIVGRAEVLQLIGYSLAGSDDRHRISVVGISALRWRSRAVWDAGQLLSELSGVERSLTDWRGEFAKVCASVAVAGRSRLLRLQDELGSYG